MNYDDHYPNKLTNCQPIKGDDLIFGAKYTIPNTSSDEFLMADALAAATLKCLQPGLLEMLVGLVFSVTVVFAVLRFLTVLFTQGRK